MLNTCFPVEMRALLLLLVFVALAYATGCTELLEGYDCAGDPLVEGEAHAALDECCTCVFANATSTLSSCERSTRNFVTIIAFALGFVAPLAVFSMGCAGTDGKVVFV